MGTLSWEQMRNPWNGLYRVPINCDVAVDVLFAEYVVSWGELDHQQRGIQLATKVYALLLGHALCQEFRRVIECSDQSSFVGGTQTDTTSFFHYQQKHRTCAVSGSNILITVSRADGIVRLDRCLVADPQELFDGRVNEMSTVHSQGKYISFIRVSLSDYDKQRTPVALTKEGQVMHCGGPTGFWLWGVVRAGLFMPDWRGGVDERDYIGICTITGPHEHIRLLDHTIREDFLALLCP